MNLGAIQETEEDDSWSPGKDSSAPQATLKTEKEVPVPPPPPPAQEDNAQQGGPPQAPPAPGTGTPPQLPAPPPPPPPLGTSGSAGQGGPPWHKVGANNTAARLIPWNSNMLKNGRKKLRTPQEIMKQVDVERADVFDKFKTYDFMPLVDSREYLRTLRAEIVSISLDGVEQVTDGFLFTLHHCKLALNSLRWVSLAGCYHITDEGIYWLTMAFRSLVSVQLMGCHQISEKALYYLMSSSDALKHLNLLGTDVSMLPANMKDMQLNVIGCPLISPPSKHFHSEAFRKVLLPLVPQKYRKLVILTNENLPWSPLAVLTNQNDVKAKQGLTVKSDWLPFADLKSGNVEETGMMFNVFEVPVDKGFSELILSRGCMVVLAYELKKPSELKTVVKELVNLLTKIMTRYQDCVFTLMGLSEGSVQDDMAQTVLHRVQEEYSKRSDRLNAYLRTSIHLNWRMALLDFHEQEVFAAGEKMVERGKSLVKASGGTETNDKETMTLLSTQLRVGSPVSGGQLKFLQDMVNSDKSNFPWRHQLHHGHQVQAAAETLSRVQAPLQPLAELVMSYLPEDVRKTFTDRNPYRHVGKILEMMTLWGKALYFPVLSEKAVLTDLGFMVEVIEKLFYSVAPLHVTIRCLGSDIPCWTVKDLYTFACPSGSQERAAFLTRVLERLGCLLRFPCDPWMKGVADSAVYVLYQDLPDKPAVPIEEYWPADLSFRETQRDRYYSCVPGLPQSFFPNLLRHCGKLGCQVLVWKTGSVIQKGPVTVLVELLYDYMDVPVIVVSGRVGIVKELADKMLGATLTLYTSIVDYLVRKYKIYAAKTVPCCKCHPTLNRYQILERKGRKHFELEHLLSVGEKRGLVCKLCNSPSVDSKIVKPYYNLSSLVPYHDLKDRDRPPQNFFNRCLMCSNCAVEGPDCSVNLRHGISSWHCLCNREGRVCDSCGMCQRCHKYLGRLSSYMSPSFDAPQLKDKTGQDHLSSLDKVLVTVKGSTLGFIEENSRYTFPQNMTTDYFPVLEVTYVSEAFMEMEFKLNDVLMLFDTRTGFVVTHDNEKICTKEIEGRVCKEGDTLRILLEYAKNGFSQMNVLMELNGFRVFCFPAAAQEMVVTMTALDAMHIQVACPGRRGPEGKVGETPKTLSKSFPSAMEMSMFRQLSNMEDLVFGSRGISLSGVASVTLPSEMTMKHLQFPSLRHLTKEASSYHYLCLSWNPKSGKRDPQRYRGKQDQVGDSDSTNTSYINNFEPWTLWRLIHLLDDEGIPAKMTSLSGSKTTAALLWCFHFIMTSYPRILLPHSPQSLFPADLCSPGNQELMEVGMRDVLRLGFWKHFLHIDMTDMVVMFAQLGKANRSSRETLLACSNDLQEALTKNLDKSALCKRSSKFNAKHYLYLCEAHASTMSAKDYLPDIPLDLSGPYGQFLSFIDLSHNFLKTIPEDFFKAVPNLFDVTFAQNELDSLPGSIQHCQNLGSLTLTDNNLTDLPAELKDLTRLTVLEIGGNMMTVIPPVVMEITTLQQLSAPHMLLTDLPENIGNLVNLKRLHLFGNCFTSLPKSFSRLVSLEELLLSGVPWVLMKSSKVLTTESFRWFLMGKKIDRWLYAHFEVKMKLRKMFWGESNSRLDIKETSELNAALFNLFPRFGYKGQLPPDDTTPSGFPEEILGCTNLRILHMRYQGIVRLPEEISRLGKLVELDVSNSPNLLSVPAELATIKPLKRLDMDDCPMLKTPPKEIRDKGFASTFAYLQRLLSGALPCKRTKLMLVGLGGAGKTSLVQSLLSQNNKADLSKGQDITDGIDINTWQIKQGEDQITYNVWDFAGQTVYYNTHQFFLSNRAVYLLLWNVRLGHEHAGLDFWLSSISVQAPKAPIFVVGSHIDQVNKIELPMVEMQQRYPQIVGFHFVSSLTGKGVYELQESLIQVTLQQQYMGEHIPAVWLTFENNVARERLKNDVIEYKQIENIANLSGIFESSEIYQAVQFLHDLGSLQHFTNDYLKSRVVINPQWIVDVMACLVSVKHSVIKEGRLHHDDISEVWKDYPKQLHNWMLRLTEEFDLTFPSSKEPINLVPCMLPEMKPEFKWPEVEKESDVKENKMIYKFDYLPAGLFNRGQVRLQQLSDGSLIWKKGSFLRKNGHIALLQQSRDSELVVMVQGPRPENVLFLVHEVFEGLIAESFHGVTYDFLMPCPECTRTYMKDPHLFAASTIRRAIDMEAPFLQCVQYFHTISCVDLLTLLPPDSSGDFDIHLVHTVQGLKDLRKDLMTDIFLSFSIQDTMVDNKSAISPLRVCEDLKARGFKCWYPKSSTTNMDEMAKALIDSSVVLAFVSTNYANQDQCISIFKYARLTLSKPMIVVAVGTGFDWKQSKLGILLADEVFVNMTSVKVDHYDSKFEELLKALEGRTNIIANIDSKPVCFISYSWSNSATAVELGTRALPGALGYGDPRVLKEYLEKHGVSCWIDVERVGMNGLFDDIAEGLLSAKVVVVCVSDEYASSPTCQIEFRYAANTLKLPIIVAVMGTGDQWRATEVGLLSVYYPIVNFQEKTKTGKKKLLRLVREKLAGVGEEVDSESEETVKRVKDKVNEEHKNLSYQELFELLQRKLLRQLSMFAENQDTDIYPRLLVADFVKEDPEATSIGDDALAINDENIDEKDEDEEESEKESTLKKPGLKKHPPLRRLDSKILEKKASNLVQPGYKIQKFCVHILCEHDEGWHSVCDPLPLPEDFGVNMLDDFCPYLARITAVMKYNKHTTLTCQEDEIGQDYIKWLEESPRATVSDYQEVYFRFTQLVIEADTDMTMGNLARCHLPNGKTIWLCNKHRQEMRLTVLRADDKVTHLTKDAESQANNAMLQSLRTTDAEFFSSMFTDTRKTRRFIQRKKAKGDDKTDGKDKKEPSSLFRPRPERKKSFKHSRKPAANLADKAPPHVKAVTKQQDGKSDESSDESLNLGLLETGPSVTQTATRTKKETTPETSDTKKVLRKKNSFSRPETEDTVQPDITDSSRRVSETRRQVSTMSVTSMASTASTGIGVSQYSSREPERTVSTDTADRGLVHMPSSSSSDVSDMGEPRKGRQQKKPPLTKRPSLHRQGSKTCSIS